MTGAGRDLPYLATTSVSVILIWSGAAKLIARHEFMLTLERLGLPGARGHWASLAVPAIEVVTGMLLQVQPTWLLPRLAVLSMALAFATAGMMALRRHVDVDCACFGALGGSKLGWRQVAALPLWLGAVAIMSLPMDLPQPPERTLEVAFVICTIALMQAWIVGIESMRARADRRATEGG